MLRPVRKKVRRNGSNNVIPLVLFQDLSFIIFSFSDIRSICNFHCINKQIFNQYYTQTNKNWKLFFYAIANASYIDELVKDPEKRHINYLLELRSIHSKDISKNYKQFRTKKQWMQQRLPYDVPLMKDFQNFRLKNIYFRKNKCLYLKTPVVKVLNVKLNKSRFSIGGYYLFVQSSVLKAKLMKIIKKWKLLDTLNRKNVLLQFTNYNNDYWNAEHVTVFEFEKYLRGRDRWLDETTQIYKEIMANVGIGIDYNPHRLWPKRASITFEITLHTIHIITYLRVVAKEIQFL